MGSAGFILGGLLSGVGKGMEMTALQAREDALEKLRQQRQIEAEGRAETATITKEARQEGRDSRNDERDYRSKVGLLGMTAEIKQKEGETNQQYEERKIRLRGQIESGQIDQRGAIETQQIKLREFLGTKRDAESIKLRAQLDSGEVSSIEQADNGELVKVMKDGTLVRSGIRGMPKEKSAAAIEAETEANRQEDRQRAKAGLPPIDRSKKEPPEKPARPSNPPQNGPWYSPGAGNSNTGTKVMTAKDIAETAKATGRSPEEIRQWAKANGYREQ